MRSEVDYGRLLVLNKLTNILFLVAIAIFTMLILKSCDMILEDQAACNARGGIYVKQAIGYTCLELPK